MCKNIVPKFVRHIEPGLTTQETVFSDDSIILSLRVRGYVFEFVGKRGGSGGDGGGCVGGNCVVAEEGENEAIMRFATTQ